MHGSRQPRRVWRHGHGDCQGEFWLCCLYLPSPGALDVGGAEVARGLTEQGCEASSAGGFLPCSLLVLSGVLPNVSVTAIILVLVKGNDLEIKIVFVIIKLLVNNTHTTTFLVENDT